MNGKRRKPRKINYLHGLIRDYMQARGMTSDDLGRILRCDSSTVRKWINTPGRKWTVERLLQYCDALGLPYAEALEAAAK